MKSSWRRVFAPALFAFLSFALSACAVALAAENVKVKLSLDSPIYQIGQPVRARVSVKNESEKDLLVPALDGSTLEFLCGQAGTAEHVKRDPILPEKAESEPRVVKPGEITSREFLFTRLTPDAGEWGVMTALSGCRPAEDGAQPLPTLYSAPVAYAVSTDVMFQRDPYSGLITREDALRLAIKQGGLKSSADLNAVLVPLEDSGLYLWVVFAGKEPAWGKGATGVSVNPYSGAVTPLEAKPTSSGGK